jgi:hypothetical protein
MALLNKRSPPECVDMQRPDASTIQWLPHESFGSGPRAAQRQLEGFQLGKIFIPSAVDVSIWAWSDIELVLYTQVIS